MISENVFGSKKKAQKVLVVDDCLDSLRLISTLLDRHHCDVTLALDGADSIPLLLEREFDLLVLDWSMPKMNGAETLISLDKLLTERRQSRIIPFVVYTGHDLDKMIIPETKTLIFMGTIKKDGSVQSKAKSLESLLQAI